MARKRRAVVENPVEEIEVNEYSPEDDDEESEDYDNDDF
jgi:hypothetical protein